MKNRKASSKRRIVLAAVGHCAAFGATPALAQEYPNNPVKLIEFMRDDITN